MPFLAPLIPAVAAFAASDIGGILIGVAVNVGVGLLSTALNNQNQPQTDQPPIGMDLTVSTGDDIPLTFPMGSTAYAGKLRYEGSWGNNNGTPNAYLTKVIVISDVPTIGNPGVWDNSRKLNPAWTGTETAQGFPIPEYRVNGKDFAWVKVHNGNQTEADPFLVAKFGTNTDWPWTNQFIGIGLTYVIVTTLFNSDDGIYPNGDVDWLFEPGPIPVYDLRNDSTNGGSGSERWDDPATWSQTVVNQNPVIGIYNIIRGIYYGDEWIWGGRNLPGFRLPAAIWIAAANICDVSIVLAGGINSEPQFRYGVNVSVDNEPLDAIQQVLQACNGRIAEIGGIWEITVGAPGAAVYAFTDADIVIARGQTFTPEPGLQNSFNAIEATYNEPSERWATKDAPALYNATLEAQDGDRRLVAGIDFKALPFPNQVQRVMRAMINDDRRWRIHSFCLPPSAWVLTGNCIVSYSSARNGYVDKKFIVTEIDGEPGMLQVVTLLEIDPTDYDWSSAFQLPFSTGTMAAAPVTSQPMFGWQAVGVTLFDNDGVGRRPSIEVTYAPALDDVVQVHVQVKLNGAADDQLYWEGYAPYASPYFNNLAASWPPLTQFQVRGKFVPGTSRPTDWSSWLLATTPKVGFISDDLADATLTADKFVQDLQNRFQLVTDIPTLIAQLQNDLGAFAESVAGSIAAHQKQITGLAVSNANAVASIERIEEVAITASAAVATLEEDIIAVVGPIGSAATWKAVASSDPTMGVATISFVAKATNGEFTAEAVFEIGASIIGPSTITSYANLVANNINFISVNGDFVSTPFFTAVDSVTLTPYVGIAEFRFDHQLSLNGTAVEVEGRSTGGFTPFVKVRSPWRM